MYDPFTGRFLQKDPLEDFFPGESPYGYAYHNPVMFNDPTGLAPEKEKGGKSDKLATPLDVNLGHGETIKNIIYDYNNGCTYVIIQFAGNASPLGPEVGFRMETIAFGGGGGMNSNFGSETGSEESPSPSMGESSDMPHKMKGTGGAGAGGNGLTPEEERLRAAAVRPAEWRREPRIGEQVITATDMFNGALKGIIHEFLCFSLFSDISEVTSPAERPYAESTADATAVAQMGTGVGGIVKGGVKTGVKVTVKMFNLTKHGELTNGVYTVSKELMKKHVFGGVQGKSIFYPTINAEEAVLKAAQYADEAGLWAGNKAKVSISNINIGTLGNGQPTNVINIYRKPNGFIHGSPGTP